MVAFSGARRAVDLSGQRMRWRAAPQAPQQKYVLGNVFSVDLVSSIGLNRVMLQTGNSVMIYEVEYTDTFAGQANYGWVRRAEIEAPEWQPDQDPIVYQREIMRRAKAAVGITGL